MQEANFGNQAKIKVDIYLFSDSKVESATTLTIPESSCLTREVIQCGHILFSLENPQGNCKHKRDEKRKPVFPAPKDLQEAHACIPSALRNRHANVFESSNLSLKQSKRLRVVIERNPSLCGLIFGKCTNSLLLVCIANPPFLLAQQ